MSGERSAAYQLLLLALLFVPLGLIVYKLIALDYSVAGLIPVQGYRVALQMQVDGHGEDIRIATFLPPAQSRQPVQNEQNSSGPFLLSIEDRGLNRVATWETQELSGRQNIRYSFFVQPLHLRYRLPGALPLPTQPPPSFERYLEATEGIQADHPLIAAAVASILPRENPTLTQSLRAIHRHLQREIENREFAGYTDALTALRLGEASCNGKSRLFAAMARYLQIPARLVGGVILNQGSKQVTHQWVEAYVNGHWVPFDTINGHFAELPANYLALYYGDEVLFSYTANTNFSYSFRMEKQMVPRSEIGTSANDFLIRGGSFFELFEEMGISQELLRVLLMLPFGALLTVVLKNMVGLQTFGTFLPPLIASSYLETGLLWGTLGFLFIILLSALVTQWLEGLQILHTPKISILLTVVILLILAMTATGVHFGIFEVSRFTLFPVAILTITAEQFAHVKMEHGGMSALRVLLCTLGAVALCYGLMTSIFLQSLVVAFPEILLVVVAADLWLGKWIGIRLSEYVRFRQLLARRTS